MQNMIRFLCWVCALTISSSLVRFVLHHYKIWHNQNYLWKTLRSAAGLYYGELRIWTFLMYTEKGQT